MNFDLNRGLGDLVSQVESFVNSNEGQELINQGAGIVERSGDRNYIKAVLIAEALEKTLGAKPSVMEIDNSGRYILAWQGSELQKGQQYMLNLSKDAVQGNGEPAPVVVDFFPLVRPVALKYGAPTLIGSAFGCAFVGYLLGRR